MRSRFAKLFARPLWRPLAGAGTSAALFGLWSTRKEKQRQPPRWSWTTGAFCLSKDDPVGELSEAESLHRLKVLTGHCCGEDSFAMAENPEQLVLAIADGVGGWRKRGVDPAQFSRGLMLQVRLVVTRAGQKAEQALLHSDEILRKAFHGLVQSYLKGECKPFGSSTACIVSLQRREGLLDVANLGDSGMLVIRDGSVLFRTAVQQSRFNAPYQTTLRPNGDVDDMTHMAERSTLPVQAGDILLLATDGLWDNVWERDLVDTLTSRVQQQESSSSPDKTALERIARDLVQKARVAAASEKDSPFANEAKRHGKDYSGGKPDDITVLIAVISDTMSTAE